MCCIISLHYSWFHCVPGTTPRGDTGGGPSWACKYTGLQISSIHGIFTCQGHHLLEPGEESHAILNGSLFVQILWLCACLTIKDLRNEMWLSLSNLNSSFTLKMLFKCKVCQPCIILVLPTLTLLTLAQRSTFDYKKASHSSKGHWELTKLLTRHPVSVICLRFRFRFPLEGLLGITQNVS